MPVTRWLLLPQGHSETFRLCGISFQAQGAAGHELRQNARAGQFADDLLKSLLVRGLPGELGLRRQECSDGGKQLGHAGRERLKLLDQTAERSDVGAVHRHRKVSEGVDQVIIHCVATSGESEPTIVDRRGAKHKLARMELDAVLCTSAQHILDTLHVGVPVRVVDQDVLHHLSDVVNACEYLVSMPVVLVPG